MPGSAKPVVFIETSVWMAKGQSKVFADAVLRMSETHTIVTSELVLDEMSRKYTENLRSVEHQLKKNYGSYFPSESLPTPDQFMSRFRAYLRKLKVHVVQHLPRVEIGDLVRADLANEKPFKDGRGLRDSLHWMTFVDHVKESGALSGVFLTLNHKDFQEGENTAKSLLDVAQKRQCHMSLSVSAPDLFVERDFPPPDVPKVNGLDGALGGWMMLVEDSELLSAMRIASGPRPSVELRVTGIRDKEVHALRKPADDLIQMVFRATFDCVVTLDVELADGVAPDEAARARTSGQSQAVVKRTVRLEWTVEAPYDDQRGVTGIPRQIAPWRRLDPTTGEPFRDGDLRYVM